MGKSDVSAKLIWMHLCCQIYNTKREMGKTETKNLTKQENFNANRNTEDRL